MNYVIGEFIYMLPSDMNLRIGKVKNFNNKILISSPSFKIRTNLKISLDGEKDKLDVKSNKEHKQDVKSSIEFKRDVKMIESKPVTNKITYEEEKVALVLGITSIFTVWWMFK